MLIFFAINDLQSIINLQENDKRIDFLCDGNYKYNSNEFRNSGQLYTIHCLIEKECFPIAFILTQKCDTVAYKIIFNCLRNNFDLLSTKDVIGMIRL